MFRKELKDNVKNKIIRDDKDYENLKKLIEIIINLNDKLYNKAIRKRYNYS